MHCSGKEEFPGNGVGHSSESSPGFDHWLYLSLRRNMPEGDFKIIINKITASKEEGTFQKIPVLEDCPDKRGKKLVSRVNLRCPTRWPGGRGGRASRPQRAGGSTPRPALAPVGSRPCSWGPFSCSGRMGGSSPRGCRQTSAHLTCVRSNHQLS